MSHARLTKLTEQVNEEFNNRIEILDEIHKETNPEKIEKLQKVLTRVTADLEKLFDEINDITYEIIKKDDMIKGKIHTVATIAAELKSFLHTTDDSIHKINYRDKLSNMHAASSNAHALLKAEEKETK